MTGGIRFKVCGLTSVADAQYAAGIGADYVGFNFYPPSPRYLPLERYKALAAGLPNLPKVAVSVEPTLEDLAAQEAAGFNFFQIHFRHDIAPGNVAAWSRHLGTARLWLAPKLPPQIEVQAAWLALADHFMLDTFQADKFGGTGHVSDWPKFKRHSSAHPEKKWILAGGLSPDNIADALDLSGAKLVDVNSGVETSPGVKDHAKLKAFTEALKIRAYAEELRRHPR